MAKLNKGWTAEIGDQKVLMWARCGNTRILAVVADNPPRVIAPMSRTPEPDLRIENGHVLNRNAGRPLQVESRLSVLCDAHRMHELSGELIADAIRLNRRAVAVSTLLQRD